MLGKHQISIEGTQTYVMLQVINEPLEPQDWSPPSLKFVVVFFFLLKRIFKGTSCVGCSLNWSLNPCVRVQCIVNCVTSSRKRLMWSCKHPVAASNAQRDLQTNKTEKESESVCRCASKLTFRFRIFTNLSSTWTASLPPSRLSLEDRRNCGCRFNTIV